MNPDESSYTHITFMFGMCTWKSCSGRCWSCSWPFTAVH